MTWSQAMFAYCGVVMPAIASVLGGWLALQRSKSAIKGALIAGLATLGTVSVMAVIASVRFPDYPMVPVSEIVGVLLTLPCVFGGSLSFLHIDGTNRLTSASRFVLPAILLSIWLVGAASCYSLFTWPYRKALPWFAKGVREQVWEDGFLPDFVYFMKAQISEKQFNDYVGKFGLRTSGRKDSSVLYGSEAPRWMHPVSGQHEVYEANSGQWSMSALYSHGSIYVKARRE